MALYEIVSKGEDATRAVVGAPNGQRAITRLLEKEYTINTITNPADAAKLVAAGAKYLPAADEEQQDDKAAPSTAEGG